MSLRGRTIRAGAWTLASYSVEVTLRLASNLIMTRLLSPQAFGVVAAALAIVIALQLLSDFGVRTVIIQSPRGDDPSFLRSAWVFQLTRGILLWLLLATICWLLTLDVVRELLSPDSVFSDPAFSAVTLVFGITILLSAMESTAVHLNVRRLNFRPIVIVDLSSRLLTVPVMIIWAYLSPTVWAIVAGALSAAVLRVLLTHIVVPGPRMAIKTQKEHRREIIHFGKWINLSSIATFFGNQSDVILLGTILAGPLLGVYYIAKTLCDTIESLIERLNASMTLSVLGEVIRTNPGELRNRYYRFRLPIEALSALASGFLMTGSDFVFSFLYDQRYAEGGQMLRALSIGLFLAPFPLIRSAFTAIGRADIVAMASIVQAISLVGFFLAGYYLFGPIGAIYGFAASRATVSLMTIVMAWSRGWISPLHELRGVPIYGLGLVLGSVVSSVLGSMSITQLKSVLFH